MLFNLKRPCANCPFRTDKPIQKGWLGEKRSRAIAENLTEDYGSFSCHKTLRNKEKSYCAGALIMLEKEGLTYEGITLRLATICKGYNPKDLDLSAKVFSKREDFINWHTEKRKRK
jgi:hypothetical protein